MLLTGRDVWVKSVVCEISITDTTVANKIAMNDLGSHPLKDLDVSSMNPESDSDSGESYVNDLIDHFSQPINSDLLKRDLKTLGPDGFIQQYLHHSPKSILAVFGVILPDEFGDEEQIQILRVFLSREYNRRQKLAHVTTFTDVVTLLNKCTKILVIVGAGISTSLGIPDFRSAGGIYDRLEKYNLSDPQEMFDIELFRSDPSIFYDFARELIPDIKGYTATHAFLRLLQDQERLLRIYSQNIDDIESSAGIRSEKLVQCHGSFRTASCLTCGNKVEGESIFPAVRRGEVPRCQVCNISPSTTSLDSKSKQKKADYEESDDDDEEEIQGLMKPDITFFGEQLPTTFRDSIISDRLECDMLLCIGTSLRVAPVAEIPNLVPRHIPQVNINRDPARGMEFDVELLGDGDEITTKLADGCGWGEKLEEIVIRGRTLSDERIVR
jgi:NAD+-dependent protein deacetylase SIR2